MQINIPVHNHNRPDGIYEFDARGIAKRFRHAAIFGALDSLVPGERMRFVNDHNPIPLLQQMQARYGDRVEINYLDQGPQGVMIDFVVKGPELETVCPLPVHGEGWGGEVSPSLQILSFA
jgi:uncharacterized protein (DUF2249 family)